MRQAGIVILCALILLGITVNVVTAENVTILIDYTPGNLVITDNDINIRITASNSSGYLVGNLIIFSFDNPIIGSLTPTSILTDQYGQASTTFHASSTGGIGNLSVVVHYMDNGVPKEDSHIYTIQVIPIPDLIKIETRDVISDTEKIWVVANGSDRAKVSVWPINKSSGYYIPYLRTDFTIPPTGMGTISPSLVITGLDGRANSIFTSGTKSGSVLITGKVTYPGGYSSNSTTLYIDHDFPTELDWFDAPVQALVGENVTIRVHYRDQFNNSIDNRHFTEYVTFSVTSPSVPNETARAGFWNGTTITPSLTIPLDSDGIATGLMRMDLHPGLNKITVHPLFSGVSDKVIDIEGISEAVPVYIEQQFSSYSVPDPYPNIPADGVNVFTIVYTLRDQFGNGVKNAQFWMNTSPLGENTILTTNLTGQIKVTYGPKTKTDIINITATAVSPKPDLTYATNSKLVEIVATEPVQMVLMANPQLLPSWDVPGNPEKATTELKAVVMDQFGNPVKNQLVNFTIGSWHYSYSTGNNPQWIDSSLTTIQKNTSTQGYALAYFRPGYFPGLGYPQEHDNCTITARWASYTPQSASIQWTNVPFLSIITNVSPLVAAWNDTVTVNVKVIGNGYALQPKPIDVILCTDRSGSMLLDNPDRMYSIREAAKQFVNSMTGRDKVGLVTFGYSGTINTAGQHSFSRPQDYINNIYFTPKTYSDYATIDNGLDSTLSNVSTKLDYIVPDSGTPMRYGLYKAIKELISSSREDAIKAVILLSDGDYNWYGDPLARGTWADKYYRRSTYYGYEYDTDWHYGWTQINSPALGTYFHDLDSHHYKFSDITDSQQNLSKYATDYNITIYSIGFGNDLSAGGRTTLQLLATTSGGKYYNASATNIVDVYNQIAGELKQEAGVGVNMDQSFDDVTIATNTSSWPMEGKDVFDYLKFTDEWKYWFNGTTIYRNQNRDDTSNWTSGLLSFNIGTIKLEQTWETTYHLKVKNTTLNVGRITFFDEDSVIQFSDGKQWYSVSLPTTYLTCIGGQPQTPIGGEEVEYFIETPTIKDTIITQSFNRTFMRNGTPWLDDWDRTWYETYYISIPGCRGLTKIGHAVIQPPVPLRGSYTFDIKPYLCEGQTQVTFNFYVEGTDNIIGGSGGKVGSFTFDPNKIYILLK